ncbi:unnamed protein product [Amoebophrya sp. A120]|nr:unnamed protein product [Amoebophrya sp. A120]|eukprot:GSA120T00015622001.1
MSDTKPEASSSAVERENEETEQENEEETKIGIGGQEIPLQSLNFEQLKQLAQQLQVEINQMNTTIKSFNVASERFRSSAESLAHLRSHSEKEQATQKRVLVPLNNSVYMDGFVSKPDEVLVDVGTGYYCQKNVEGATKFLDNKVEMVQANMAQVAQMLKKKQQVFEEATGLLMKMQQQMSGA